MTQENRKVFDVTMKELEERTFHYAKEAGLVEKYGFKNGKEVLDALERFGKDPKNRKALAEMMKEK